MTGPAWRRGAVVVGALAIVGAAASVSPGARAEPVDLRWRLGAPPRHLRMRRALAAAPPASAATTPTTAAAAAAPTAPTAPVRDAVATRPGRGGEPDEAPRRPRGQKVSFRVDLGFAVDGAAPSGRRGLAGDALTDLDYQAARAFGYGNVFASTQGLLASSLSSYLSMGFRITPALQATAPLVSALDGTDDLQIRAGWVDATGVFEGRLLAPLRLRAGRMYVYGPQPVHLDGTMASWQRGALTLTAFAGQRVADFEPNAIELGHAAVAVSGTSAALDLAAWRGIPASLAVASTRVGQRDVGDLQLAYRRSRRLSIALGVRTLDARLSNERIRVRSRLSPVTHLVFEVQHRQASDWRYDAAFVDESDPAAPRRYLELGPTPHQALGAIRAGTVLLDNIDLAVRIAGAADLTDGSGPRPTPATRWAEAGGALEVRLRRSLSVGLHTSVRDYELTDSVPVVDVGDVAQALPLDPSAAGAEIFAEGGLSLRVSLGARRFSAAAEIYGRRTRYADQYREDTPGVGDELDRVDDHGGGRFALDAWVNTRLRLGLAYELSTALARSPEINGFKSLRVVAEGSF